MITRHKNPLDSLYRKLRNPEKQKGARRETLGMESQKEEGTYHTEIKHEQRYTNSAVDCYHSTYK